MNEPRPDPRATRDAIAIAIQQLHAEGKTDDEQPLVRLDYRQEAARAPFQFDSAKGKLHRTGCPAIPETSRPALYAVWAIRPQDLRFACARCRPMTKDSQPPAQPDVMDLAYGVLSVVDQFRSILFERGREYRQSVRGRKLEGPLAGILAGLGQSQERGAATVLSAMDSLLEALNACNQSLTGQGLNGNGKMNGGIKVNGASNGAPHDNRQGRRNGSARSGKEKSKRRAQKRNRRNGAI